MQENYGSGQREAEADGQLWNTLPVTFEANAPTMRAKRLPMFPPRYRLRMFGWPEVGISEVWQLASEGDRPNRELTAEVAQNP